LAQRQAELGAGRHAVQTCRARLSDSQETMLRCSSIVAHACLEKESLQKLVAELIEQRDLRRADRGRLAQQAQTVRQEWRTQQEAFTSAS